MGPVNLPEIVAEVTSALNRYEQALMNNNVAALDQLFWESPYAVRLGATENLYGTDEIRAFRNARPPVGLARHVTRTQVTTFGRDFAVAHREYLRGDQPGRQSQTWVRTEAGWQIVSAHVSSLGK